MESITDLLKAKKPSEPPQLQAMKDYAFKHHNIVVKCSVTQFGYQLTVPNASLASTLHMETPKIIQECNLDKKLLIRIGHF
jgi:hypothetical protein